MIMLLSQLYNRHRARTMSFSLLTCCLKSGSTDKIGTQADALVDSKRFSTDDNANNSNTNDKIEHQKQPYESDATANNVDVDTACLQDNSFVDENSLSLMLNVDNTERDSDKSANDDLNGQSMAVVVDDELSNQDCSMEPSGQHNDMFIGVSQSCDQDPDPKVIQNQSDEKKKILQIPKNREYLTLPDYLHQKLLMDMVHDDKKKEKKQRKSTKRPNFAKVYLNHWRYNGINEDDEDDDDDDDDDNDGSNDPYDKSIYRRYGLASRIPSKSKKNPNAIKNNR
jgi:hypothetical protein